MKAKGQAALADLKVELISIKAQDGAELVATELAQIDALVNTLDPTWGRQNEYVHATFNSLAKTLDGAALIYHKYINFRNDFYDIIHDLGAVAHFSDPTTQQVVNEINGIMVIVRDKMTDPERLKEHTEAVNKAKKRLDAR